MSLDSAELGAQLPVAVADRALPGLWRAALARRDGAAMARYAGLAVNRAPLEPGNTALYAATQQFLGREAQADAGFRVAATMGWRVPSTQLYWLQQGVLSGDYRTAARRLDALMRMEVPMPDLPAILDVFESNPFLAAAFVDQAATAPPWLDAYVAQIGDLSGERLVRRLDMIGLMAQAGVSVRCDKAGPVTERMVQFGHVGEARQYWALACGGSADSVVADGNFAQLRLVDGDGPFRWAYQASGDVSAELAPDRAGGGQWLVAQNHSAVGIAVIRQRIVVPAGRYRLEWSSPAAGAGPLYAPATGCVPENTEPLRDMQRRGGDLWQANITVDGSCGGTWLAFWLASGGQGRLGRVTVVPESR